MYGEHGDIRLTGNTGDAGLIPAPERSPGGENGNPLQYSFLENSMDGGAWQTTVYRVARSWTQLSMHTQGESTLESAPGWELLWRSPRPIGDFG